MLKMMTLSELQDHQPTKEEASASSEISYRRGYAQAIAHVAEHLDEQWLWDWVDDLYTWRYQASGEPNPKFQAPPKPRKTK